MYIYLDDSGNIEGDGKIYVWAGFSLKSGYKVLERELERVFKEFPNTKNYPEKKAIDATPDQIKQVFECLISFDSLRICYLVVDKSLIHKNHKTYNSDSRNKEQGENFYLSKVIKRLAVPYADSNNNSALITIDGSPRRPDSQPRLHEYLSLRVNFPVWNTMYSWNNFKITYDSGANRRLMQAADFVANTVLEYYKCTQFYSKYDNRRVSNYSYLYSIIKPKIVHKLYRFSDTSII
ncbi:MAG: DUF3800 domain-containing protein [Paenibacillus sp.]|nr:DUF3800 domain-containing protein [Paenibacillus sp.]